MKLSIKRQRVTILLTFLSSFLIFLSCAAWTPPKVWTFRVIDDVVHIRASQDDEDFSPVEFLQVNMEEECGSDIESEYCAAYLLTAKGARSLERQLNSLEEQLRECEQRGLRN